MTILDLLREDLILPRVQATEKRAVIEELSGFLATHHQGVNRDDVQRALNEREQLGSTAIGDHVAIPHAKLDSLAGPIACLARSVAGVEFDSVDGKPTHLFFVLIAPKDAPRDHLLALASFSRLFKNPRLRARLEKADSAREMYQILAAEDAD